ncbi:MAG TPA: adenylate/guanylate cyclase domain-containing protein [Candidatus Dormibacteraeota bacterium]
MNSCPSCGGAVGPGQRFCGACGAALAAGCARCGAPLQAGQRFCANCGAPVEAEAPAPAPAASQPAAEVRLVSVLFVDLVGFTSLSETRDAEDMRELLSSYFAVAREVVGRHGGSIEKFIGDAVMAVWGAPLAHEDDALRAVRAALELVAAVSAFAERVGAPDLRARGGIVTGRAASWASSAEGLVVGDRVNTASRVQSAAPPGGVLVDSLTREATRAGISYQGAGMHQVKGKAEPIMLWQALSPIESGLSPGGPGEVGLSTHGRELELERIKEVFQGAVERSEATMLLVSGAAGIGKSRLLEEFDRYVDEIPTRVLWHAVGCTSYGSGVAYWGLSRIFRQRLGVADDDQPETVLAKLAEGLATYLPDQQDRDFAGPKVAVLLGLPGPEQTPSRDEFFAGWRTFLDGLARSRPVVLAIENLQWADSGLLDFLEYLLAASSQLPVVVFGLARPELLQRREEWSGRPQVVTLQLDRLGDEDIGSLLEDLVPGMPVASRRQVVDRAEGIPLYAVETVRMLADRGLLVDRDGVLSLAQDLTELDTPVSLEALIAARLDELDAPERALVKDLAVLGLSFGRNAVEGISMLDRDELARLLQSLQRKQVLTEAVNWRETGEGGYAFSQTLLRTIAYDRLGKRERRARHLAVASHLRSILEAGGEDVPESIADHYRDAYLADPAAADAGEVRVLAVEWLARGAARAASVGAPERSAAYLLQAADLVAGSTEALTHREGAAQMYFRAGRVEESLQLFEEVALAQTEAGRGLDAARLEGEIGSALGRLGRAQEAIGRLQKALQVLDQGPPSPALARVCSQLGRELSISGSRDLALPQVDRALVLAEQLDLPQVLCDALETKALLLRSAGEYEEALQSFERTIEIAEARGLAAEELLSGHANSADTRMANDLPQAIAHLEAALGIARRLGQRYSETFLSGNLMLAQIFAGDWQGAEDVAAALLREEHHGQEILHSRLVLLHSQRGQSEAARAELGRLARWAEHDSSEPRTLRLALEATVLLAEGSPELALTAARSALEVAIPNFGLRHEIARQAWPDACQAAVDLGQVSDLEALLQQLAELPKGVAPPYLEAQALRYQALGRARAGELEESIFRDAAEAFAGLGYPYWQARTVLDWAEAAPPLGEAGREVALEAARAELERLGAGAHALRAGALLGGQVATPLSGS